MKSPYHIYLDFNATTPVDPQVLEFMMPFFSEHFANASSKTHFEGRQAGETVEIARNQVASFLGAEPSEIIFTSGATESINLAIRGVAEAYKSKGRHIITWETEHKAVLDTCNFLEQSGYIITKLPVDREGLPDLELFKQALTEKTILVAVMLANNETGVIMPVNEISRISHAHGSLVFCDATQAAGKLRIDVNETCADLLSISAHKMYGPKGTGALFVRRKNPRVVIQPLIFGGGHENGMRAGTYNVPGIAGMGKACEVTAAGLWEDASRTSKLRTLLEQVITDNGLGYVNGSIRNRIPNTTNVCFPGIKASSLISSLPQIALATGSACTSALPSPSHVLRAMGLTESEAHASVRLSVGRITTLEEVNIAAEMIRNSVKKLKGIL